MYELSCVMGWSHDTVVVSAANGTRYTGFRAEQGIAVAGKDEDRFLHCYLHP